MTSDEKASEQAMVDEAVGIDATAEVKPKAKRKPKVVDGWASRDVAPGASGPTVKRLRASLGFDDGSDVYDRRMKIRVLAKQRSMGLPETGVITDALKAVLLGS